MNSRLSRMSMSMPIALTLSVLFAAGMVIYRPGYLTSVEYLGMLIFLQVLLAIFWKFNQRFFPFLIVIFLAAATPVPLQSSLVAGRWFILGAGALAGCIICLKDRRQSIRSFHVVGFLCVLAALVSAAPAYPSQVLLKALSLFLLVLYGSFGVRFAVAGREKQFMSGLLLGCELLIYALASIYLIFHIEFLGNPNSLGALMGMIALPVMLWGILVSDGVLVRRRRIFAFLLALFLLLGSYSRASIVAAAISCALLCIVLRRYGFLIKGSVVVLLTAVLVATIAPPQAEPSESVASAFLYKGHQGAGVMDSRTTVWEKTLTTIQDHPWLGTGFGMISTSFDTEEDSGKFASNSTTTREHGSSYLAIVEGVGLLGVAPFLVLVLMVAINATRVLAWVQRTRDPLSLALPIAAIMVAGLVHAAFEDWLFAVGNYLCVFFWSLAFVLVDILPPKEPQPSYSSVVPGLPPRIDSLGIVPQAR